MCDDAQHDVALPQATATVPVGEAVGMVLAHDITEIRQGEFKGRAFKKGHVVREEDIAHLRRLGKEQLYLLRIAEDEMHEDAAAHALASALMGTGVRIQGEPKEGKINIVADRDGMLRIDREALLAFNMLGEVMCASMHSNSRVRKGQIVAGTRAVPLVVKKNVVDEAVRIAERARCSACSGVIEVRELRKPRAGIVITGNEVYYGRVKDAFGPVITKKLEEYGGEIVGVYYAPDDQLVIESRLRELLNAGADLLITTGGMSVDPDDVTRFAIRNLGAVDTAYGSAVLPGAMVLVGYVEARGEKREPNGAASTELPIIGIPACGMYHKTTIFDLLLPRILGGERIGRRELAELGYGGLCLHCEVCRYPVCPFGKS